MTLHSDDRTLDMELTEAEATEETTGLLSRRTVLRRSALGIMGIGLAPLLAACGDDEAADDEVVEDTTDEEVVEEETTDEGAVEEEGDGELDADIPEEEEEGGA